MTIYVYVYIDTHRRISQKFSISANCSFQGHAPSHSATFGE